MLKILTTAVAVLMLWPCADAAGQSEPAGTRDAAATAPVARAQANDHANRAGRMVGDELHVELEAVEAEWFPRGPDGPRIVTPAFAEAGRAPAVPGPLIRAAAGTPVVVTVTNRLERAIKVRGLAERGSGVARPPGAPSTMPDFFFADSLVVPAGESRTVRFTQGSELSSFYYGRTVPPEGAFAPPSAVPGGIADEGAFMGALVMDPPGSGPHADERVFMITRWGSPEEPGSLDTSWKMMINGQAWPATERIELTVGDTARWRIINASAVDHPMHLHGFYFLVDGTGDTHADTVFPAEDRREVVTEVMKEYSSLRLRWAPDRPGNWLFHCHLIRHMGELQRFQTDRDGDHGGHDKADMPEMDGMAGLITGITVHPAPGVALEDPTPVRRIDLWTGRRDGVFDDQPELGFVVQEGPQPPSPDSTRVPGSPLVLTRGEPTEIVVHNRLDFPLSVHWHGLELRSLYDGVGHWSGAPGMTRPPIPPADSQRVIIDPPRAGTFFYHTHGEPGHELQQGLYGAFLVLDEGESWDRATDRVYVLASRGAQIDAAPSINGQLRPEPEHFQPDRTYRLRFIHISPDEYKRVRLLRDGEPVEWVPVAKDGADLPPHHRVGTAAELGIAVGEAYDFLWTPEKPGAHVLEVRTDFYPNRGGSITQRQAFAVGDVSESDIRTATTGTDLRMAELTATERRRYVGTYVGRLAVDDTPRDWVLTVWEDDTAGLYSSMGPRESWDTAADYLIPLGDHTFVPGRFEAGLVAVIEPDVRIRFGEIGDRAGVAEVAAAGGAELSLERVETLTLTDDELLPLVGSYTTPGLPVDAVVEASEGALTLRFGPGPPARLIPLSRSRFRVEGPGVPPGAMIRFAPRDDRAAEAFLTTPGAPPIPLTRNAAVGSSVDHAQGNRPAGLLYVWMGDVDRDPETGRLEPGDDSDFLAIWNVDPESASYGDVVATQPVDLIASMPHHTEYRMPGPGQPLFANAHMTEDVLLFDLSDAVNPRVARVLDPVPPLRFPHDMVELPNGNVIVGYLRSEGPSPMPGDSQLPGGHGGLAEFTRSGDLVRWASAAVDSLTAPVRPYSFAALPEIDRLVVTSAPMMERHSADVVQIWRLSDLALLHTLPVPPAGLSDGTLLRTRSRRTGELEPTGHTHPFVPRVMHDGSVLFNAFGCGLYRMARLQSGSPTIENVYTFAVPEDVPMGACGVPVQTGRYWVMTVGAAHALVALDVEDPATPRRVSVLETGPDFVPHWLALDPGSHRLIVGAENGGEDRMLMARLDPATGELTWDETLRERNGFPGIDFRRASWPHGDTGLAFGHAAVFGDAALTRDQVIR